MIVNVLFVTAHPESKSFNFALRNHAIDVLESEGVHVQCSDLCQNEFFPVPGKNDFGSWPPDEPLQLAKAQNASDSFGGFSLDIVEEQKKLLWADVVLLQFPIWWGTYPAILKGWIERVFTYGFAYGREKNLLSKAVMLSVTTGGAADEAEEISYRERVAKMTDDVFGFMRWTILEPLITHGPSSIGNDERLRLLADFETHLRLELLDRV